MGAKRVSNNLSPEEAKYDLLNDVINEGGDFALLILTRLTTYFVWLLFYHYPTPPGDELLYCIFLFFSGDYAVNFRATADSTFTLFGALWLGHLW